jgi:glutamyl-tRNA reductase
MAAVPPIDRSGMPATPSVPFAVGVNHRTAPADLRERLYVGEDALPAFLARLRQGGLTQAVVLSTCDRTEIIGLHADAAAAIRIAAGELVRLGGLAPHDLTGHLLVLQGDAVIEHLFAIAASLDSVVVGEPQVLGQVRDAYRLAGEAGLIEGELDRLMQAAFATAKRIRNETAIGRRSISMATVALQIARDVHGSLDRCAALFIGAGEMGDLLATKLREAGIGRLVVTDSLALRAQATARRLAAQIAPFDDLAAALVDADIVLTALGHGVIVIDAPLMQATLRRRRQKPVFLIDAAVPGDIAPAVNDIDEVFLYDLDDLERLAQEGREQRGQEAEKGWAILREAVAAYARDSAARDAVPALAALRAYFESARGTLLAEQPGLDAEEATRLLINRLLHRPSEALRGAAAGGADRAALEALMARLFAIDPDDRPAPDGAADPNESGKETPS